MTKSTAERIAHACEAADMDVQVREYSGRFMFGESTWAVVASANTGEVLAAVLNHDRCDEGREAVGSIRQDEFGRGIVLY